jgi:hypothetical protein
MSAHAPITAEAPIRTPYGAEVRRDAAIREIRDRFYVRYQNLLSDMQAEINCVYRAYERGDFA